MSDTTPRLGFIGAGGMGSRMASRLLAAGYHVTVYDRSRDRSDALRKAGAGVVGSPRELATVSDVLLSSVTDDTALGDVMYGEHGAVSGAAAHSTIVDLSTVRPTTSRALFVAARDRDVDVLDAPVSGSLPQAKEGQLVIFVGGEKSAFDRTAPLLNVLGSRVLHMGPSGSGTLTKLCANTLLGLGFEALAEAVVLGEREGLSREQLLAALAHTTVLSPSQQSKIVNLTRDEYPSSFPLRLMFKGLFVDPAAGAGAVHRDAGNSRSGAGRGGRARARIPSAQRRRRVGGDANTRGVGAAKDHGDRPTITVGVNTPSKAH
ncbi:MAG TPA: NAD(P)-dependent oxidoreductase [Vicinamibacterales bacterium]|nr:NAD(P)-dependent oxidoreductase [Vicinamibacterales bacterium]